MKNIKNLFQKLALAYLAFTCYLLANPLGDIAGEFDTQMQEAGSSIAQMINTFLSVIGILWIIIMLILAKFQPERLKDNLKGIVAISIILGIAYGLTEMIG